MAIDYAEILRDLADIHFPNAEKIVLVQDNLNLSASKAIFPRLVQTPRACSPPSLLSLSAIQSNAP